MSVVYANLERCFLGNGENNGTVIKDLSPKKKPVIFPTIGATTVTSVSKYRGSCIRVPAGGGFGLNEPLSFFAGKDFTIEAWVMAAGTYTLHFMYDISNATSWFRVTVSNSWLAIGTGASYPKQEYPTAIANTWRHIAFIRSGTDFKIFLNGVALGSSAWNSTNYYITAPYVWSTTTREVFISDYMITWGAKYSDSFTPGPIPSFPVSGIIQDINGLPCERAVKLYERPSGLLLADTMSDPLSGVYSFPDVITDQEMIRVVNATDEEPLMNDLVDRILPAV